MGEVIDISTRAPEALDYESEAFKILMHAATVNSFFQKISPLFEQYGPGLLQDLVHFSGYLMAIQQLQIQDPEFAIDDSDREFFESSIDISVKLAQQMLAKVRQNVEENPDQKGKLMTSIPPFPPAVRQFLAAKMAEYQSQVVAPGDTDVLQ